MNDNGYSRLHLAAQAGHLDACKLLIMKGVDKGLTTKDGKTSLHLAQENGHNRVVALLS